MDFLARREHSFFELKHKLESKFPEVDSSIIENVINILCSENLQSDARFTESYVYWKKKRGFGYLNIRANLNAKHIKDSIIDSYLFVDDDWHEIADNLVEKRISQLDAININSKEYRRLVCFLQARGFKDSEICLAVRNRLDSGLLSGF
mgnify:FL=1